MSYNHNEMPPIIRRTEQQHYQLEGQSGIVIEEYNRPNMSHPSDWWSDLIEAMQYDYSNFEAAIHDLTLLSVRQDWTFVDDR